MNHRAVDSSIHISGQLPFKDGELLGQGIVGRDVGLERAQELASHAVQMLVFLASTPGFGL